MTKVLFLQVLEVYSRDTLLGSVTQEWSIWQPKFYIRDASGQPVLMIKGPLIRFCIDVIFKVLHTFQSLLNLYLYNLYFIIDIILHFIIIIIITYYINILELFFLKLISKLSNIFETKVQYLVMNSNE